MTFEFFVYEIFEYFLLYIIRAMVRWVLPVFHFQVIIEGRLANMLTGWKMKLLSKFGKEILIMAVA